MDVTPYLKRIGLEQADDAHFETLKKLQYQHMLRVPFENLDGMRGIPIVLDVDAFYEKIVEHHRGGYCYENNGLYNRLLRELGFTCQLVSGTIHRGDGTWARTASHACTVVTLDGKDYLTDVGFGDSARGPLALTGEVHQDVSGAYRMNKVAENTYDVERMNHDDTDWRVILRIDITPMKLTDFKEANDFNQTSPHSPFMQKDMATIATVPGRRTLSGNKLTITENGTKQEHELSDTEKKNVLEKDFYITNVSL